MVCFCSPVTVAVVAVTAVAADAVVYAVVVAAVHVIAVLLPFLVCLCSDDSIVAPGVVVDLLLLW